MRIQSLSLAACVALAIACGDTGSRGSLGDASLGDAVVDGGTDSGVDAALQGETLDAICADSPPRQLHIAASSFGPRRLQLERMFKLMGVGADSLVEAKVQGLIGLVPYRGGLTALAWDGFWDLPFGGEPRWIATGTIVHGAAVGDVDGDGDDDLLTLSSTVEGSDGLVTHLLMWERTATGIVQQSDLRRSPTVIGMPLALNDIDADGDLDVLTYEQGAPVGYIHDGAFGFAREVLGESVAEGGDPGTPPPAGASPAAPIAMSMADRDRDGVDDMLLVLSSSASEFLFVVFPGNGRGGFDPAIVTAMQETTATPGIGLADVTGDGLEDIMTQQYQDKPLIHLTPSVDATHFAPVLNVEPGGRAIRFADFDGDGTLDIITTVDNHLTALASRSDGSFEALELGLPAFEALDLPSANPWLLDYATTYGASERPQRLYLLFQCRQDAAAL